jgi:hypothetical protein
MYYWDTDIYNMNCKPMSYRGDRWDMACTLARITLLLTGAEACTPRIVASVWGEDELLAWLSVAHEAIYHSFVANFSPSRKWQ